MNAPLPTMIRLSRQVVSTGGRASITALIVIVTALVTAGSTIAAEADEKKADAAVEGGVDYFRTYVEPILKNNCYECHSHDAKKSRGGLVLDSRAGILTGGDSGPAAVPGDPSESRLVAAIRYEHSELEMPPDGMLSDQDIDWLTEWVEKGLPHAKKGKAPGESGPDYEKLTKNHWSLQPVRNPKPPEVKKGSWPRSPIDRFVLARLEKEGLEPVGDAEAATLLRRLHFDLVGLPPEPKTVESFLALPPEKRPQRLKKLIDELLGDPAFGERWGRHWLDVVRFAESNGKSRDVLMPHAWRYRDWVYDAVAADLPFDQFITKQLAGDLLPADSTKQRDENRIATGLLAVGAKSLTGGTLEVDMIDDQIDVVSQGVLGMTVACARCHDHKFDPIPTEDYYSLAGIFKSTETLYGYGLRNKDEPEHTLLVPLGDEIDEKVAKLDARHQKIEKLEKERKELDKKVEKAKKALPKNWKKIAKKLPAAAKAASAKADPGKEAKTGGQGQSGGSKKSSGGQKAGDPKQKGGDGKGGDSLSADEKAIVKYRDLKAQYDRVDKEWKAARNSPEPDLPLTTGVREAKKITDAKVHIRGEKNNLGEPAPRGFLDCVQFEGEPEVDDSGSGRLELARWLTHPNQPLTPRVAVNRVWYHLFGRGLVTTKNNFGVNGESPSHPELLDYLAHRFVHEHGWSMKSLVRELVNTRTYQLSSALDEKNYAADPENRYFWRMNRKRLEAEPLRDAILTFSGQLKQERPPFGSRVAQIGHGEVGRGIDQKPLNEPFHWRAAYLPILRTRLDPYLKTFDFPEPSNPNGERIATNVPAQALWFMNSEFVNEQASQAARRLLEEKGDRRARLELAFKLAYGRPADDREPTRLESFLAQAGGKKKDSDEQQWTSLVQALMSAAEFRYLN